MFAIVRTGGKQYKAQVGNVLVVEKIEAEVGSVVTLDKVLLLGDAGKPDAAPQVGTPFLEGVVVKAEVIDQGKGEKVIIFKKKRRHTYRRKNGHRQLQTVLRVTEVGGKAEAKAAAPKKEAAAPKKEAAAEAKPAAEKKVKAAAPKAAKAPKAEA